MHMEMEGGGQEKRISSILSRLGVILILVISFSLNLWGNRWGAPDYWHPDELTRSSISMFDKRTIMPPTFYYGGLHYYVLEAGAVLPARIYAKLLDPKPEESDPDSQADWEKRLRIRTFRIARGISAVMATIQVFLSCQIGSLLFGRTVGILAALFLGLSPYFIAISHFATIDTPANFWYWLSFFLALMSWKRKSDAWFSLACITAGLTVGVKIDRLVIIVPLFFSYLSMRKEGATNWNILKFTLFILAGYALANPAFLLSPFEFLDGTTRDLFFNMGRGDTGGSNSYIALLADMKSGMGVLTFLAAMASLVYSGWNFLIGKDRTETGWLLSSLLPYYLLIGSHLSMPWYAPFFFPGLAVFAAYGCKGLWDCFPPASRVAATMAVVVIIFSSALSSLSMVTQFPHDSRYLAAKWVDHHIPAGASIEMMTRGPDLSSQKYRIVRVPEYKAFDDHLFAREWRDRLDRNTLYRAIRTKIVNAEQWMSSISGRPARRTQYKAWFDLEAERVAKEKTVTDSGNLPFAEKTDFVILVGYMEGSRISALSLPTSGYRLLNTFQYHSPFGIPVRFPFVNPEIYVFSKSRPMSGTGDMKRASFQRGMQQFVDPNRLCRMEKHP